MKKSRSDRETKRLGLRKESLRQLDADGLRAVVGGATTAGWLPCMGTWCRTYFY